MCIGLLVTGLQLAACGGDGGAYFVDRASRAGVDFVYTTGSTGKLYLPEIAGGGLALFDADGDADLDLYFANGNAGLPEGGRFGPTTNRYYRNEGGGEFVDATDASGLGDPGYGMGVAVGDVDNDGDLDVFLSNFGPDRLYLNDGAGLFEDVTDASGIDLPGHSASAAFLDYDRDGLLDLFVTQYVRFDPETACRSISGQPEYCGPASFDPLPDVLLHNEGGARFRDVSREAGLMGTAAAGLGVAIDDFDADGWIDVYVANDGYANNLWINQQDGRFVDRGIALGAALNMHGQAEAGMGVIAADFDGDLSDDLFMTHLYEETNTLYRSLGPGRGFQDASGTSGMAEVSSAYTGFGTVAFDLELDGDLDVAVANGRVKGYAPLAGALVPPPWDRLAEPNLLLSNDGAGRFALVDASACGFCAAIEVSRGLTAGDLDDDGDIDMVMSNLESPARLLFNEAPRQGAWIRLRLVDPDLRREAYGARAILHAGGTAQARTLSPATSYLSSGDPRLHFGLGAAAAVDSVEVRWPDGLRERFALDCVDCERTLMRGAGQP